MRLSSLLFILFMLSFLVGCGGGGGGSGGESEPEDQSSIGDSDPDPEQDSSRNFSVLGMLYEQDSVDELDYTETSFGKVYSIQPQISYTLSYHITDVGGDDAAVTDVLYRIIPASGSQQDLTPALTPGQTESSPAYDPEAPVTTATYTDTLTFVASDFGALGDGIYEYQFWVDSEGAVVESSEEDNVSKIFLTLAPQSDS